MRALIVLCVVALAGCGVERAEDCGECSVSATWCNPDYQQCDVDDCELTGECPEPEPEPTPGPTTTWPTFELSLKNTNSVPRACQLTYQVLMGPEQVTAGAVLAADTLGPGETRASGKLSAPKGATVRVAAGCWDPASPDASRATIYPVYVLGNYLRCAYEYAQNTTVGPNVGAGCVVY